MQLITHFQICIFYGSHKCKRPYFALNNFRWEPWIEPFTSISPDLIFVICMLYVVRNLHISVFSSSYFELVFKCSGMVVVHLLLGHLLPLILGHLPPLILGHLLPPILGHLLPLILGHTLMHIFLYF